MKFIPYLLPLLFFAACHADPGVLEDDEMPPIDTTHVAAPLKCDSLLTPNAVFSNAVGEMLVFSDSLGTEFDTLICVENEAFEMKSDIQIQEYCQAHYSTGYEANWLPAPERYAVAFRQINSWNVVDYYGTSVGLEDFTAKFLSSENSVGFQKSITINGKDFNNVNIYRCLNEVSPCAFVQSFVFQNGHGLVGFYRKDKWWVVD